MTTIKARLNRSRLGKDDMYPLIIQVIHNHKKREIYTPYRLREAEFNAEAERAVMLSRSHGAITAASEINSYLIYIKEELERITLTLEKGKEYTADGIVNAYKTRNDLSRFFVYAAYLTEELKAAGKYGTAANYRNAISAFTHFIKDLGEALPIGNYRNLSPNDITKPMLEKFITYLEKRGNNPNTVTFYIKQLRAIYNKADDDGYVRSQHAPFDKIRLRGSKTPKRAISKKELARIAEFDLHDMHKHLQLARDLFLFSLYARGMAFIDMCYLTQTNIRGNMLIYRRRKTGQLLQIKIEPPLQALLRRYADPASLYLLPMLRSNDSYKGYRYVQRRLNKRIRQIGNMLNFDFPLTFYVARHTWATLAYEKGIPVSVISEGMGHTSEKTTRIYLASLDHQVIDRANRIVMDSWKQ
ncbi:MAG: site-specific integrase [Bacteroides sp.]|nr:site-specific integrase [Bacteroides sp.]